MVGCLPDIKYLVEKGANVNIRNYENKTALSIANELGNTKIIKYLLTHGAVV